ncbi:hypothetical protein WJX84_003332 [Apatococcus fuscideae]|uniref:Uncharacterized protein n=1 Tax=Apatococcus fuscideae TaxID=2026836 RepID=A0AAW1THI6_9CHLO
MRSALSVSQTSGGDATGLTAAYGAASDLLSPAQELTVPGVDDVHGSLGEERADPSEGLWWPLPQSSLRALEPFTQG